MESVKKMFVLTYKKRSKLHIIKDVDFPNFSTFMLVLKVFLFKVVGNFLAKNYS